MLDVIILAHGRQSRLPNLAIPKHLLTIPSVGETILGRTLRLIREESREEFRVTVYGTAPVRDALIPIPFSVLREPSCTTVTGRCSEFGGGKSLEVHVVTFDHGTACILGRLDQIFVLRDHPRIPARRTVLLLGDVVWSHRAIRTALTDSRPVLFVGTADLSPSSGELFAMAWNDDCEAQVKATLADTPRSSNQLRRLLWRRQGHTGSPLEFAEYVATGDWTSDIDTEYDVHHNLRRLGQQAEADDLLYQRENITALLTPQ